MRFLLIYTGEPYYNLGDTECHRTPRTTLSSTWTTETATFAVTGTPVSADFDGDGKANYALKNGADWLIMNAA
ncbi:MAG: hypothetical protein H0V76_01475, partial [Blastocatellia bacterium]|nr:hypothetical protein [Blastocatellia bacterium]